MVVDWEVLQVFPTPRMTGSLHRQALQINVDAENMIPDMIPIGLQSPASAGRSPLRPKSIVAKHDLFSDMIR